MGCITWAYCLEREPKTTHTTTCKAPREGIEPSPFPTNQAMHSDQCFGLSAKQSTVYPPKDSTRVKVKTSGRGNNIATHHFPAPSPETLILLDEQHFLGFVLKECLNQSLVRHGNPMLGYSDHLPATNSYGWITSNTSDHSPPQT